jgi:transposase
VFLPGTAAEAVAVVALRSSNLTVVCPDDELVALRLLVDRRDELARARTQTICRLHRLLLELIPGGAKRFLSAAQAQALLDSVAPTDVAGRIRHQLAAELLAEIVVLDAKMKASDKTLRKAVTATGTGLLDLYGLGPVSAARILGDVGGVARFASRARFASWNGTAPLDASSGDQKRHRLSRAGNRRINRALHIMAIVQIRHDTEGRAYFRRRIAAGKTKMEALRALKRRLSDVVYRQLVADAKQASPGGPRAYAPQPRHRRRGRRSRTSCCGTASTPDDLRRPHNPANQTLSHPCSPQKLDLTTRTR